METRQEPSAEGHGRRSEAMENPSGCVCSEDGSCLFSLATQHDLPPTVSLFAPDYRKHTAKRFPRDNNFLFVLVYVFVQPATM